MDAVRDAHLKRPRTLLIGIGDRVGAERRGRGGDAAPPRRGVGRGGDGRAWRPRGADGRGDPRRARRPTGDWSAHRRGAHRRGGATSRRERHRHRVRVARGTKCAQRVGIDNNAAQTKREARGGFRRGREDEVNNFAVSVHVRTNPRAHSERARRRANDDRREGQTYEMQYGGQNGGFGQQGDREKQRYVMMDARKSYTNTWATDLMSAPCTNPGFCLYAACWCVSILPPRDLVRTRDVSARAPDPAPRPGPPPGPPPHGLFSKHRVRTRCWIIPHPSFRRL